MIHFLLIYKWSWLAALFGGCALSLLGAQMASRNQSVQTMSISQGASLGIVIALAFTHSHGTDQETAWALWPTLIGLMAAGLTHFFCESAIPKSWTSRNTYFVGLFAVLLSITYMTISLVPNLESHMAASFFGDISVASNLESQIIASTGFLATLFLAGSWRPLSRWSFDLVTFRSFFASPTDKSIQAAFIVTCLVVITTCVQFLGLLFTLSCLFLPALVLTKMQRDLRGLGTKIFLATSLGVTLGLMLSLWHGKLPTSSTLTLTLLATSLVVGIFSRWFRKA